MKVYIVLKRIIDFLLALSALVVLGIPLLIIGVFIKLESKGPVFFLQERLGKDGKVFKIYKYRTMVDDAIKLGSGIRTSEDDPRITKVGNFLRKTSLDEIPQIINILKGEMSIIGPRPPVPYHPRKYEEYSDFQKKRFEVLPGITGLAQVVLRNSASWDERIVLDVQYVENMNFKLDTQIFLRTIFTVVRRDNIYSSKDKRQASKINLINLPTPIEEIDVDSKNNYYIKRDDLTGFCFGGNKARKMEYFLYDILEKKSDYIVTYGSPGSNHCRIVSAAAKRNNLPCLLIFNGEKQEIGPEGNDLLNSLNDANIMFVGEQEVSVTIDETMEKLKSEGFKPYFIEGGGHGNLGTLAYKEAYDEIKAQSKEMNLEFDYIFLASGTGTTQAGLIAGSSIANGDEKIIGISIARTKERGTLVLKESLESYFSEYDEDRKVDEERIIFLDHYTFGAYAKTDPSIYKRIKSVMNQNSIALDPTYTGKAFEGMCKYLEEEKIEKKNILFIHTGGTPLFFSKGQEIIDSLKE